MVKITHTRWWEINMNPDSVLVPVQQSEEVSVCEVAGLFLSRKLNVHLQKFKC